MKFPLIWRVDYERAIVDRDNWQAAYHRVSTEYEMAKQAAARLESVVDRLAKAVKAVGL